MKKATVTLLALLTMAASWTVTGAAARPGGVARTTATPQDQGLDGSGYADGTLSLGGAYWNGSASCRTATGYRKFTNVFGYQLYRYNESITWCWSYGAIRSFYRDRWPSTPGTLSNWQFDGHIGSNCSLEHCNGRGVGQWSATADTRGKFHACVVWWCSERYPYISITVYGNGNATASTSG
jgi:hypothetical protein